LVELVSCKYGNLVIKMNLNNKLFLIFYYVYNIYNKMEYLQKMFTTCKMNMLKSTTQLNSKIDEHKNKFNFTYNLNYLKNLNPTSYKTKLFDVGFKFFK